MTKKRRCDFCGCGGQKHPVKLYLEHGKLVARCSRHEKTARKKRQK